MQNKINAFLKDTEKTKTQLTEINDMLEGTYREKVGIETDSKNAA